MKQCEERAVVMGAGAATIRERSSDPDNRRPVLTLMLPGAAEVINEGFSDAIAVNRPAQSISIDDFAVRQLYDLLASYFDPHG
jgi:hypothetical protein